MNRIDIIIIAVVLLFAVAGYSRGLVKTLLSLVKSFAAIILSIMLAPKLSTILIEKFSVDSFILKWVNSNIKLTSGVINLISEDVLQSITGRIINVLSIIILFIILNILFNIVISILNKVANLPIINTVNKIGGLAAGAINGILIVYLIILVINWLPVNSLDEIRLEINSSFSGGMVNSFVPDVAAEVINLVNIPEKG